MNILFRTNRMEKTFNSEVLLRKEYGDDQSRVIARRMFVLRAATCLAEVPVTKPERRHELTGKKKGMFAVDLKNPFRLVFEPLCSAGELPKKEDGGLDLVKIDTVVVLAVEDYH